VIELKTLTTKIARDVGDIEPPSALAAAAARSKCRLGYLIPLIVEGLPSTKPRNRSGHLRFPSTKLAVTGQLGLRECGIFDATCYPDARQRPRWTLRQSPADV
jgi:hypothetical protein